MKSKTAMQDPLPTGNAPAVTGKTENVAIGTRKKTEGVKRLKQKQFLASRESKMVAGGKSKTAMNDAHDRMLDRQRVDVNINWQRGKFILS